MADTPSPIDALGRLWAIRETTHRLGLAPPLPTSHVRKTVGRPRRPQRLLPPARDPSAS